MRALRHNVIPPFMFFGFKADYGSFDTRLASSPFLAMLNRTFCLESEAALASNV